MVEEVKELAPEIPTGYILPFNLVGPPATKADFLTMEYSTINRNFIRPPKQTEKSAGLDAEQRRRHQPYDFYGADGIITGFIENIGSSHCSTENEPTYSDKLLNLRHRNRLKKVPA